jgi:hypothetical protein
MNKLFGLKVRIETERKCCAGTATIETGAGDGMLNLVCAGCGTRRGRVSQQTAEFLLALVNKFGAPRAPIILRRQHYQASSL